jgi:hypothetical protein
MSERSDEFITWTSAVCVCGGVIAGFLHSVEWLFYPVVVITALSFVFLLVAGFPRARDWAIARSALRRERENLRPTTNIGSLWRYSANGFDAGIAMTTLNKAPLLPGTRLLTADDGWCSFKMGIVVSSDPLSDRPSTTQLRDKFITFLEQSSIRHVVEAASAGSKDLSWKSYGGNGRLSNAAVLVRDGDDAMDFFAWALLSMSDSQSNSTPQFAEFILQIELRTLEGSRTPALKFSSWHNLLVESLGIASNFAEFLTRDAEVSTFGSPPPQVGIRFSAPLDLAQMIDQEESKSIPGSPRMNQFPCYLLATEDGDTASSAVSELLRGVADHALYLNGYERIFETFNHSSEVS